MSAAPGLQLSVRQKRLIRSSFESLSEYADSAVLLFYGRLFELDPSLRSLFHIEIRVQAGKLLDMLTSIVGTLDSFEKLRPELAELGRRHVGYGVKPEHYGTLATALLWALGQALGPQFDRETRKAWETTLSTIVTAMLEGSRTG